MIVPAKRNEISRVMLTGNRFGHVINQANTSMRPLLVVIERAFSGTTVCNGVSVCVCGGGGRYNDPAKIQ